MNNTPSRVAKKNIARCSGSIVNGNPVPTSTKDNGYNGIMYPAKVASKIRCIKLLKANNIKIIEMESLFLPIFLLIVSFDMNANARNINGMNKV